ncbi:peptidylprolyl isomerase [Halarcobacter bivalviorum]|uniref:Peptidylprolyl isomerase n=1 Tax=Halarcobacter bivalviorum TaxID=663364 RepID=A0AAX2A933_9BACT|nr:peptidylprolyl isomerase [Halarcobacter bivalviorum]AXH12483.1 putative periplasmic folding chaperone [Halarcobacter bivalviorum]RXK10593.1 peptidylprolyl isomerase [Halarcobacter bivalviorum]
MITWMQRHKKWLVITIWISTIAFVGAGFVGWGSYDYGSKGGAVAVVADREVSVDEYQREYSNLYEQYARMFGDQFNQEMADKLKLKDAAYRLVIQKNLILAFADELGLDVTNEEIAKELVKIPAFLKDGKFDKDTYIKVLQQNRSNPTEFEASVKRDLLLQKVESLFQIKTSQNELKNLNELLFAEDKVSIKILNANDVKVNISEEELKQYWEENKNSYVSEPTVKLAIEEINVDLKSFSDEELQEHYNNFKTDYVKEDGKIKSFEEAKEDMIQALSEKDTKKDALKKYLKLKKAEENFSKEVEIEESKLAFAEEGIEKINEAVPGDVLKPFVSDGKYLIVKVLNKGLPKPLSYEAAKAEVSKDFENIALGKELEKVAKKELENFNGTSLGYVSRNSFDKVPGLQAQEALQFLNQLFASTEKQGQVNLGNKIVLFKIEDTRLGTYDEAKNEAVSSTVDRLLNQELVNNLIKNLQNRYEVQSSITLEE